MTVAVSSGVELCDRARLAGVAREVVEQRADRRQAQRLGRLGRRARLPGHRLVEARGPRPAHRRGAQRGGVELVGAGEGGRHPAINDARPVSRRRTNARKFDAQASRATYRPSAAISSPARSKRSPSNRSVSCQVRPATSSHGRRTRACAGASERLTTTRWRESAVRPAPRDQPAMGIVVRPALAVAQAPVAVAQAGVVDGTQQPGVERTQIARPAARRARGRGRPGSAFAGPRAGRRGRGARPAAWTWRPRRPSPARLRRSPRRAARRGSR